MTSDETPALATIASQVSYGGLPAGNLSRAVNIAHGVTDPGQQEELSFAQVDAYLFENSPEEVARLLGHLFKIGLLEDRLAAALHILSHAAEDEDFAARYETAVESARMQVALAGSAVRRIGEAFTSKGVWRAITDEPDDLVKVWLAFYAYFANAGLHHTDQWEELVTPLARDILVKAELLVGATGVTIYRTEGGGSWQPAPAPPGG